MRIHYNLDDLPVFKNAVITIGSFDGVHLGHQEIIERVKVLAHRCEGESVVITFNPHPRQIIYPKDDSLRLLTTIEEKTQLLLNYGIDHVVVVPFTVDFSRLSADEYIEKFLFEKFHPHTIVIGYDHRFGLNRQGDINFLRWHTEKFGYRVVEIPQQAVSDIGISSTKIRKALESGQLESAHQLLGHPYLLQGQVVKGQQIGQKIGFPTANLKPNDKHKLVPQDGIYAVNVHLDDSSYQGMLYIGNRPSLEDDNKRSIEVNIFEFDQDIYGHEISLEFVSHLRADATFDSLAALQDQLAKDKKAALLALEEKVEQVTSPKLLSAAVVVLNYNGADYLKQFIPILKKHSGKEAEIIVADNGSTDDSLAVMERQFPDTRVLKLPMNYGFAGGYNHALEQLDHDIYILLNSDVKVTADWLEPGLDLLRKDPSVAACQPKILDFHNSTQFEYAGAAGGWLDIFCYPFCRGRIFHTLEKDEGQYDRPQEIFWATGAALFIRANLFHRSGGFDASYFAHAEEIDLCWRLKRAGYKIMALPQSKVYHMGGGTLNYDTARKAYLNFRNTLFSNYKNLPFGKLVWLIPCRLILDGIAAGLFLSQGKWSHIGAVLRAHIGFYKRLPSLRKARKEADKNVELIRRGPDRTQAGTYRSSIVWAYYAKGIKSFKDLNIPKENR